MKKLLILTILFLTSFTLVACGNNSDSKDKDPVVDDTSVFERMPKASELEVSADFDPADIGFLDIYYLNDFHGSILEDSPDELGFANIANLLVTQKQLNPENTIIIAGGDMLQGSALSNYYSGLSTINLMSNMYFDALTIGNHEFDWGLDVVTNYFDGNEDNGEASFPLLGANVFNKGTETIPENIDPYVIIERGDLKIGIIGTIEYGIERTIAVSKINDYEFGDPVDIIKDYVHELRTENDVDIVLVASHDSGGSLNAQIAALEGDYKVNAIFNGHSHSAYANTNLGIPVIQSDHYGKYVGHVRLNFTNNLLVSHTAENIGYNDSELLRSPNQIISDIISYYESETDELFKTPIITTGEYLSKTDLSSWIAKLMRISTGADIGFQNGGGTRNTISDDTEINLSVLYQVWPFDNVVKTAYLTGAVIKGQMNNLHFDTDIVSFEDDVLYKVATNDYTFDSTSQFYNGANPFNTGIILRDLAESELIKQGLVYDLFYIDNEIITIEEDNDTTTDIDPVVDEVSIFDKMPLAGDLAVSTDFDPADIGFLDIYYINDFHGAIEEDSPNQLGFANIANLLVTQKQLNPENTIILAGGDILQGSALSNYYFGLSTINFMNSMYFDAFTVGNHEFDWGIDVVTSYFDGNEDNGEARFALLGANIFNKGTTTIPDDIDPYVIIERGDLRIGIIGTIGYGLENSIATSRIEDYEFADPVDIIRDYVYELRTQKDVDIVLVASHDSGGSLNSQIAAFTGNYKVNAIFNGHSHSSYAETNLGIPVIQSGGNGRFVGHVRLNFTDNTLVSHSVENIGYSDNVLLRNSDLIISEMLEYYNSETDELFNTPIITTGEYLSSHDLSTWIARMMRIATGSDIGFQNSGGTRTSVSDNTVLNLSVLYQVWPFDNVVKTVYLTGAQIKDQMGNLVYDTEISNFDNNTLYKVATNDYVFDKTYSPYINGTDPLNTGIVLRDLAESELIKQSSVYDLFYIDNVIITTAE